MRPVRTMGAPEGRTLIPVSKSRNSQIKNRILAALSQEEYERLAPHLQETSLSIGSILYDFDEPITHVHFPNNDTLGSLLSTTELGPPIEIGVTGSEGLLGFSVLMGLETSPHQVLVQVPGTALKIKSAALRREFKGGGRLHDSVLRFTHALFTQASQTALCNRLHSVEERLARWLLTVHDRIESDEFPLTHDFMARMLGANRATVSLTAATIQQAGYIRYTRGKLTILDREGLEDTSCDCYGIVKKRYETILTY
jgi:CRP-like cAMP-binding protein